MDEAVIDTTRGERALALDRSRFWTLVAATLTQVFRTDGGEALAKSYRIEVEEEASPRERLLTYHTSPLQIAADLAGVQREITGDERKRYLDLQKASLAHAPERIEAA